MCVNTELRITQAIPVCEIEVSGVESEEVEEESISPEFDLSSGLGDQVKSQDELHKPEVTTAVQQEEEPKVEASDLASKDPLSVTLGARIFKDLIDQYTGQEKTRNRTKTGDPSEPKMQKPPAKSRKMLVREQIKKRRANPKTKEERNLIRRAQLRAKPPNFVCDLCGQAFRMSHNLRIHQLRHTRTKNYQCTECPMAFYDAYMRNIHVRVRHRGETPYSCRHCPETFAYAGARQKHERWVLNPIASVNIILKPIWLHSAKSTELRPGQLCSALIQSPCHATMCGTTVSCATKATPHSMPSVGTRKSTRMAKLTNASTATRATMNLRS